MGVADRLRATFLGGVVPLELRDAFATWAREGGVFYIPYSCKGFWHRIQCKEFLMEDGVEWWDGDHGVMIQGDTK